MNIMWLYLWYCITYLKVAKRIYRRRQMAPHSSTLAWKIPWTEEPGGLQSMGSLQVRHDWATSLSLFTFMLWRRKWQPTPVLLPGESQGWGGAWWAAIYGVAQSRTQLKWLSSSSSSKRYILKFSRKKDLVTMYTNEYKLDLLWWSCHKIHKCQIIMLCVVTNDLCHIYFNFK